MGLVGIFGKSSLTTSSGSTSASEYASIFGYNSVDTSSNSNTSVDNEPVGYDDGWGNVVTSNQKLSSGVNSTSITNSGANTSEKKSFFGSILSGISNLFTIDSESNYSNNETSNSMGVATGIISSVAGISGSVADILTSGDKIEIAKYQAQGDIAKANAIIAEAQAKADAQAEAEKAKSNLTTYIIVGAVVLLIVIIVLVVVMSKKPAQGATNYPQYQIQKPIMPTNYVQSASPPRQLQPVATS